MHSSKKSSWYYYNSAWITQKVIYVINTFKLIEKYISNTKRLRNTYN